MHGMRKKSDFPDRKKAISRADGLTVVEGGLRPPSDPRVCYGDLVMAEVTDTRLMGVIGIHVCRRKGDDTAHQFFYLDAEEYGIDEYTSVFNCSPEKVEAIKRDSFGALGGSWNEISEEQAVFLIKDFILFTDLVGLDLPEPASEYVELADRDVSLSRAQYDDLWEKMCVPITTDIELINYFIMRCAGMDVTGAARLCSSETDKGFLDLYEPATLFRNRILPGTSEGRYICEMLLDDGEFHTVIAGIEVRSGLVVSAEKLSSIDITPWEASLILRRDEYLICNRYDGSRKLFGEMMTASFTTMTVQEYEVGTLYMIFNKNNDHVRDSLYRLDRDTMAAILLLNNGELVVAGDDPGNTGMIENMIVLTMAAAGQPVTALASYRFGEQVVGAFLDSDFNTFNDFLEYIQSFERK